LGHFYAVAQRVSTAARGKADTAVNTFFEQVVEHNLL